MKQAIKQTRNHSLKQVIGASVIACSFILFGSQANADILTPAQGTTIDATSVTFEWEPAAASEYAITVRQNGVNVFFTNVGTNTSATASGITLNGLAITVYVNGRINGFWQSVGQRTYNVSGTPPPPPPEITIPVDNSVSTTEVTFGWEDVGASMYQLTVGSKIRGGGVFRPHYAVTLPSGTTSHTVEHLSNTLKNPSGVFYAQLSSLIDGHWYRRYRAFTNNIQTGPVLANITSPVDGSTLDSTSATFEWEDLGATHWLIVRDYQGHQLFSREFPAGTTSKIITNLPSDGHIIRADLYTQYPNYRFVAGFNSFTYTAYTDFGSLRSEIFNPADGSTLTGSSQGFSWSDVAPATEYHLSIGTSVGGQDLYSASQGLGKFKIVHNLPTDGSTIYLRISVKVQGTWRDSDSTVTAYTEPTSQKSEITSPVNGSTFTSTTVTFQWQDVSAQAYYLRIGTTPGWSNNLYRGHLNSGVTSKTISNLPNHGETVYVRLYSKVGGTWRYNDYVYTAVAP